MEWRQWIDGDEDKVDGDDSVRSNSFEKVQSFKQQLQLNLFYRAQKLGTNQNEKTAKSNSFPDLIFSVIYLFISN